MTPPFSLSGRTILVTGAGTGIGRATAVLLSTMGARLVLVARRREKLEETAALLEGTGHAVEPFDLSQVQQIPQWMRDVSSASPLWGVVHCAARLAIQPLQFLNLNVVEEIYRINVVAAFALAKGFRQRGVCGESGSIVLLSAVAALIGDPGNAAYSASKAALAGVTRTLAAELAPQKIRVNSVAPGWIPTEMSEAAARRWLTPDQLAAIQNRSLLGAGTPEDVAGSIAFLLSDASRWITGTTLLVDGGFLAH
jgi:NAD(P)-dependent dehydrogenase (short-subunit alcohol dehydrogenase family)